MKKRLVYSSVLTALLSASSIALAGGPEVMLAPEPDYFNGFYVGGFGSAHHDTFSGSSSVDENEPVVINKTHNRHFIINKDKPWLHPVNNFINSLFPLTVVSEGNLNTYNFNSGEFDGYGGIDGGFGWTLGHRFYVGLYGSGAWGSSSDTETQSATVPFGPGVTRHIGGRNPRILENRRRFAIDRTTVLTANASNSTQVKITNTEEVGGKFGYLVTPFTMIYGKVGASFAHMSINNSLNANASSSVTDERDDDVARNIARDKTVNRSINLNANSSGSTTKTGLVLGAGVEQFIWRNLVSIFGEYTYTNYGHVSTGPGTLNGSTSFSKTFPNDPDDNQSSTNPNFTTNVTSQASARCNVSAGTIGLNLYLGEWIRGL